MNSVGEDCIELKWAYEDCFNKWFAEKFLKGKTQQDEACLKIFQKYQTCLRKSLKDQNICIEELEKNILGTPEEKDFSSKSSH